MLAFNPPSPLLHLPFACPSFPFFHTSPPLHTPPPCHVHPRLLINSAAPLLSTVRLQKAIHVDASVCFHTAIAPIPRRTYQLRCSRLARPSLHPVVIPRPHPASWRRLLIGKEPSPLPPPAPPTTPPSLPNPLSSPSTRPSCTLRAFNRCPILPLRLSASPRPQHGRCCRQLPFHARPLIHAPTAPVAQHVFSWHACSHPQQAHSSLPAR